MPNCPLQYSESSENKKTWSSLGKFKDITVCYGQSIDSSHAALRGDLKYSHCGYVYSVTTLGMLKTDLSLNTAPCTCQFQEKKMLLWSELCKRQPPVPVRVISNMHSIILLPGSRPNYSRNTLREQVIYTIIT